MDSAKLNDWMQVVGIFALVASLIFVGLQLRQDRAIALSVANQTRTETTIQNIGQIASNPFLMSAIDKIANGEHESLLASERYAFTLTGNMVLFNFENVHYQYDAGYVSEDRWEGTRMSLKGILARPHNSARHAYEQNPQAWRKSFRDVVDALLAEVDAEAAATDDGPAAE